MAIITLREAASLILQESEQNRSERLPFFFVVGAGISNPPLPLAGEITEHCKREAQRYRRTPSSSLDRPIDQYSTWFQLAYPAPVARQEYLRGLIHGRPISEANLRLAHILLSRRFATTVVTPNFDDFLSRALTLFGEQYVVCDHPRTTERIDPDSKTEIQIVHVHGSYAFYDCCNLTGEVEQRARVATDTNFTMGFLLDSILRAHSPIVVGYSGWESDVIMSALSRRLQSAMPHNIYWFCYSEAEIERLPSWLRDHRNLYIVAPRATSEEEEGSRLSDGLAAKTVFDEIIRTFGLEPPRLTHDPLGFLTAHLKNSLSVGGGEEADIYGIKGVIERLERAQSVETESESARDDGGELENVRNALRGSDYDKAVRIASVINIQELQKLEELLEMVTTAVSATRNFNNPSLPFDTLMRINHALRDRGQIDEREWRIRTAATLLDKAAMIEAVDPRAAIVALDEVVTRFKAENDVELKRRVAHALTEKARIAWFSINDHEAANVARQVIDRYSNDATFNDDVLHAMSLYADVHIAQKNFSEALRAADALIERIGVSWDPDKLRLLRRARLTRARVFVGVDRHDDAIQVTDEILAGLELPVPVADRGVVSRLFETRARALQGAGHIDEALAALDQAVLYLAEESGKPLNAYACRFFFQKAEIAQETGRLVQAIASYEAAAERAAELRGKNVRELGEKARARAEELKQQLVSADVGTVPSSSAVA